MSLADVVPKRPPGLVQRFRPGWGALQLFALVILALFVWRLADVLLLAFGAILVAALLHALADPLTRRLGLGRPLALTLAVTGLTAAIGGTLWLFGQQIAVQLLAPGELLPRAWRALQAPLSASPVGGLRRVRRSLPGL